MSRQFQMDWEKPYSLLRDIFPQVDARIIKATVLEHGDDLSSSVDFIVEEILGLSNEYCSRDEDKSQTPVCQTSSIKEKNSGELFEEASDQRTSQMMSVGQVPYGTSKGLGSSFSKSFVSSSAFSSLCQDIATLEDSIVIPCNKKTNESVLEVEGSSEVSFLAKPAILSPCDSVQALGSDTWRTSISNEPIGVKGDDNTSCGHSIEDTAVLEISKICGTPFEQVKELSSAHSVAIGEQSCSSHEVDEEDYQENFEHHQRFFLRGTDDKIMIDESISEAGLEVATSSTLEGSSFSSVQNSQLDEFVQQIKVEKQSLTSVLDEIRNLHQKANFAEEASRQARIEAARGGKNIIAKVDEMKHMLSRAREANAVYAGEVHGEKAVLATEARELLSRLVQIKAERTKAITTLNDIREGLQEKMERANQERQAAEEELLLKERTAYEALAVEEELMAKVAQESRNFEAEAEICREFREFLIDRGSIVDSLQGEMAIICEDVEALKKRIESCIYSVDEHNSSQMSAIAEFKEPQVCLNQSSLMEDHKLMDPSATAKEKLKEDHFANDYGDADSRHSSLDELYLSYSVGSFSTPDRTCESGNASSSTRVHQKSIRTCESQLLYCENLPLELEASDSHMVWSERLLDAEQLHHFEPETDGVGSVTENSPEEDGWSLVLASQMRHETPDIRHSL